MKEQQPQPCGQCGHSVLQHVSWKDVVICIGRRCLCTDHPGLYLMSADTRRVKR